VLACVKSTHRFAEDLFSQPNSRRSYYGKEQLERADGRLRLCGQPHHRVVRSRQRRRGAHDSATVTAAVAWVSAADSPTVRRTTRSPKAPTMTTTDLATDPTTTALPVVSTPAPATNPVVLDMT